MQTAAQEWRRGGKSLTAAFIGMLLLSSLGSISSVIMGPVSSEFGWSRTTVTANMLVMSVLGLVLSPVVGALLNRLGARRFAMAGIAAIIPVLLAMSQMPNSKLAWFGGWFVFGAINAALGPNVWSAITASLFDRTRGVALGIMLSSSGIAFFVYPPLCVFVVSEFGWRAIFVMQACYYAALLPLVWLWLRSGAELAAEETRAKGAAASSVAPAAAQLAGLSLAEAFRSRQFWQFTGGCMLAAIAEGGLVIHLFPFLHEGGLALAAAGVIAGLMGLSMIAGRLIIGVICDRISGVMAISVAIAVMAVASGLGLINNGTLVLGAVTSLILGFGAGGMTSGLAYVTSRYFGLKAYAAILGITYGSFGLGFSAGPAIAGFVREEFGNYNPFFLFAGAVLALALALIGLLGSPTQRLAAAT